MTTREYFDKLSEDYVLCMSYSTGNIYAVYKHDRTYIGTDTEISTLRLTTGERRVMNPRSFNTITYDAVRDGTIKEVMDRDYLHILRTGEHRLSPDKLFGDYLLTTSDHFGAYMFVNRREYEDAYVNDRKAYAMNAVNNHKGHIRARSWTRVHDWYSIPENIRANIVKNDVLGLEPGRHLPVDEYLRYKDLTIIKEDGSLTQSTNTTMNPLGNLKFGLVPNNDKKLALSMLGIAIMQDAGGYVTFNPETHELTEVGDFVFNMDNAFYLVPTTELKAGDLILEGIHYSFVVSVEEDGGYKVVGQAGIEYKKIKKSNLFGLQFYAKVVSMWDMLSGKGVEADLSIGGVPFNPLMFAMMSGGNKQGGSGDFMNMLMMQQFLRPQPAPVPPTKRYWSRRPKNPAKKVARKKKA